MAGVLDGTRVLDLTSAIAGPMATMVLSDQGAEVIKVEPPGGDPGRAEESSVVWNRGKKSVVLDLDDTTDRGRFRELLATADVVVESFAPGVMARWGLDHDSVKDALPGLVHCSLTPYGRGGRSDDRPGHDLLVQARSGQQYEQPGWRDGPIYLYAPLPSLAASYLILQGVAAALYVREVTGRGQWVETSLYQGVLAFTTQLWQDVETPGDRWLGIGRLTQPGVYECVDGLWVHSMHRSGGRGKNRTAFFDFLCIDPQVRSTEPQEAKRQDDVVRDAVSKVRRQDLLEHCWAHDIPIAPVRTAHEALDDPLLLADGHLVDVDDPIHGRTRQVGPTFHLDGLPPRVQGPAPSLGQHDDEVLTTLAAAPRKATQSRTAKRRIRHPLEGVKVLDVGNFLAGPLGTMMLADLGAEVIKLESTEGDQMRFLSMPFNGCQRGKSDIAVDLKTVEGREIAKRLIREVDVVHHNMRPGVAERLGIGYEAARELKPDLIYCHTTMWGSHGSRTAWPGFDQLGQASCGCEIELGGEGNPPVWYRFGFCDQACAFQSTIAVLLALFERERSGEGRLVETSIVAGGLYYNSDAWLGPDGPSTRPSSDRQQTGLGPLYRLYRTLDGWIALVCATDEHWAELVRVVPSLAEDVRFSSHELRETHRERLARTLEAAFVSDTSASWFEQLDRMGVPVEVADEAATRSWSTDPEWREKGMVVEYQHPRYGRMRQFGHLVQFSDTPGRIWGPPPLLGEHTREILGGLGYDAATIDSLQRAGVVTWPTTAG